MSLTEKRRPIILGEYMVSNKATVRSTAKRFELSKSTVHKDLRTKLPTLSPSLYKEVEALLELNKKERHIRGGLATKQKYKIQKITKI